MNGTNCNTDERGLLPYPVILAATKGDPEAMTCGNGCNQSSCGLSYPLRQISKREAFNPFPLCVNLPCLLLDKESGAR